MPASDARIAANRANSPKNCGPKTPEGKERSRGNALKHGLTGAGVVLPNEDAAEVERRLVALQKELQPSGEVGRALVRRAAVLSVRLDRSVSQETASLSERVRRAEADFVAPEGVDAEEADPAEESLGSFLQIEAMDAEFGALCGEGPLPKPIHPSRMVAPALPSTSGGWDSMPFTIGRGC